MTKIIKYKCKSTYNWSVEHEVLESFIYPMKTSTRSTKIDIIQCVKCGSVRARRWEVA